MDLVKQFNEACAYAYVGCILIVCVGFGLLVKHLLFKFFEGMAGAIAKQDR